MRKKKESLQHVLIMQVLPRIKNNRTEVSYKKYIKRFARWAKDNGYRKVDDISRDVIQEYENYLERDPKEYSPASIHTFLAPVCVSVGVSMDQIRKPKRKSGSIERGRDWDANGQPTSHNPRGRKQETDPKYARLMTLQKAVGIRRAELSRLVGSDLVQRGDDWYIVVRRGKGGKYQEQRILPKDVSTVRKIFDGVLPEERVFTKAEMSNLINLHGIRAFHGKECYEYYDNLLTENPEEADRLRTMLLQRWDKAHERLLAEDSAAWERQRKRFIVDMDDRPYILRGDNANKAVAAGRPTQYRRLALMCVSVLHLSHWRLDVTVTNYLL